MTSGFCQDNIEVAGQVTLEDLKTPKVAVAAKFPNERVGEIITHVHQDEGLKVLLARLLRLPPTLHRLPHFHIGLRGPRLPSMSIFCQVQVGPLRPLAFMAARMSVDLGWGSQCRLGFDLALNEAE